MARRHGLLRTLAAAPVNCVDSHWLIDTGNRHRERRFGHSVTRHESSRTEAGWFELLSEEGKDNGPHHVAANAGHPPARKVEGLGLAIHTSRRQVVAKGWRGRDRAAILRD